MLRDAFWDRIAVFDMDGTLTCETYYTYYDTMMFIEYCLVDHPDEVSDELKLVADDDEREWGTMNWEEEAEKNRAAGYIPISMKRDFAQIYKDGITKAAQQYNKSDWVVAEPKSEEQQPQEQEEALDNAA